MSGPGPALEQGQRCPVPRSPPRVSWGGGALSATISSRARGRIERIPCLLKKKKSGY